MELRASVATVTTAEPFVTSRGAEQEVEVIRVAVSQRDTIGYGEATPLERYDEDAAAGVAWLEGVALWDDPLAFERLVPLTGHQAAKAALDAALHDLAGKLLGQPVWRLLGLERGGPPTRFTLWLDDPDAVARRTERLVAEARFRRLKLKLGGRDGLDLERVRAVRNVTSLPLLVDANEAWESDDEALEVLGRLGPLAIDACEQPLPAEAMRESRLKERSPVRIVVDENCHTLPDVADCARFADGINVKLAKAGGIREAVRMIHAARALGLSVMLGCMVESGLGIAPAAHIASLVDDVDLDGNLLLRDDPWPGIALVDGVQLPSDAPGLGVYENAI
jgi:L-alanine-DL-glutamate epimerase-like enolase superfamily enzyme